MIAAMILALAPAASPPPCAKPDDGAILICGQGPQPYRLDPDVSAGSRAADRDHDQASARVPAAQAACAQSPMGCGKGLESLDLANVAFVAGSMAVSAATGGDWKKPLRPAGPGEYARYQEAKQHREELATARAARKLRDEAREAADRR